MVTQKYIANEKLCQLKTNINDVVALLKPYDPAQQTHIWFVDTGAQRGFVPASALTSYAQLYSTTSNLINLDDVDESSPQEVKLNAAAASNHHALIDLLDDDDDDDQAQYCEAMYNLKPVAANGIELVKDHKYRVIEKRDQRGDPEWWLVESPLSGSCGYVPRNYVKLV